MEQGRLHINGKGFSHYDIGEVLLGILWSEQEPLDEFLSDYDQYLFSVGHETRHIREAENHCEMDGASEFERLVRIAHSYVLECQRSSYLETGFDSYPIMTVSEFVMEIFKRYEIVDNNLKK